MIRFFLIQILLLTVLLIGLPFDIDLKHSAYQLLMRVGLDVAMTPMTVDMAMMKDEEGKILYQQNLSLEIRGESGIGMVVHPEDLEFYPHKIPLNLYFELLGQGHYVPEGKGFICRSLSQFYSVKMTSFQIRGGNDELQSCPR